MSSPVSSPPELPNPIQPPPESDPTPSSDPKPDSEPDLKQEGEEEEEEAECGFCLFMKGGGCKDSFVAWEKCVELAEKNGEDIVEKCFEVTAQLKKCMDAHAEYYEPVLRAEQAMSDSLAEESKSASEESTVQEPIVEKEEEKKVEVKSTD